MLRTSSWLQNEHLNSGRFLAGWDKMTIVESLAVNLSTSAWLDRTLRDGVRVTMAADQVAPRPDPGAVPGRPGATPPKDSDTVEGTPDFDGTTVLCQVCGDKASGFHYGVHSCEGCKGFFRRSIQQKIQYKACTKDENCAILRINRNRCQHCRLKKCLAVGMSRDAVRFGRVPKREKAAMLAAMQSVSEQYRQQSALKQELLEPSRLAELVAAAHADTCQFTAARVAPLLKTARQQPAYAHTAGQYACPLSPPETTADGEARHSQLFGPHIKAVVEFAKRLPGFLQLPEEDRVTLLKSSVFEVLLVWLAGTFDAETSTAVCLDGRLVRRDAFAAGSQPRFLLDSMFDFAAQLNSLQLTDAEVGLFCACVVLTTERPGLRDQEQIGRIQASLDATLREALLKSQPQNPQRHQQLTAKKHDLKTLNSLHADMVRSLRTPEAADGAWPACEGDTPAPTACSPASVSSGYVGSEEGRSPSPAVRPALKRPASDHCSDGAPTPSPCQSPVPGDRAPAGGDGGDQYMPLLKQALSLPALAEARAEPASLVPHKKFRWMRRESGCGEPPELEREEKLAGQPACRTPTLSKILGAPPQRAWSSEQIRQRDAVARLLGMTTPAAEQTDGAAATGQPLNLTTRPAGGADA